MSTSPKLISKDDLRKLALIEGLPRPTAWTLAIIAFWSQAKGGIKNGIGAHWQWREYSELAAETGYSTKSIGRAVPDLKARKLIEVRRVWHPNKVGRNVNTFRLTTLARETLHLKVPIGADQSAQNDISEKDILTTSQPSVGLLQFAPVGASKNIKHAEEISEDASTPTHAKVGNDDFLFQKKFGKDFQEGGDWSKMSDSAILAFWTGYKSVIKDMFGKPVGVFNGQRGSWLADYLRAFQEEGYAPQVSVAALGTAVGKWSSFSQMLAAHEGKPAFVTKEYPDPYSLGVYGHVFLDFWLNGYESAGIM